MVELPTWKVRDRYLASPNELISKYIISFQFFLIYDIISKDNCGGCSSDGRALALHVRGTRIGTLHLQIKTMIEHFLHVRGTGIDTPHL